MSTNNKPAKKLDSHKQLDENELRKIIGGNAAAIYRPKILNGWTKKLLKAMHIK